MLHFSAAGSVFVSVQVPQVHSPVATFEGGFIPAALQSKGFCGTVGIGAATVGVAAGGFDGPATGEDGKRNVGSSTGDAAFALPRASASHDSDDDGSDEEDAKLKVGNDDGGSARAAAFGSGIPNVGVTVGEDGEGAGVAGKEKVGGGIAAGKGKVTGDGFAPGRTAGASTGAGGGEFNVSGW